MGWSKYDSTGAALEGALTDFPVGSVVSWAADSVPSGWLKCDGTAVSRTAYSELYAIIGTTYGTGDGSTTFNVPTSDGEIILAYSNTTRLNVGIGGMILLDSQTFTSSTTYAISSSAKIVVVECIGAGGGGSSVRDDGNAMGGGGGGAGGAWTREVYTGSEISGSVTVTIGAGGAGAAATTGTPQYLNGTDGGTCRFGVAYFPGARGSKAVTEDVSGTLMYAPPSLSGLSIPTGGQGAPYSANLSLSEAGGKGFRGGGGGGAGRFNTTNTAGGAGGGVETDPSNAIALAKAQYSTTPFLMPGVPENSTGGGAAGGTNANGANATTAGHGGGGAAGAAKNGGNGAAPGGGGGGSSCVSGGNSGTGGNGAAGQIKVWVYG